MTHLDKTIDAIRQAFPEAIVAQSEFRGETTLELKPAMLIPVANLIRNTPALDYRYLAALMCVDYWPKEPRFAVNYVAYALRFNTRVKLKVRVDGDTAELPTVTTIWPNANWHEREVYDMFGIHFTDHPDLRRILMPSDWEGHPHRKDYPLGYEEVQFTFTLDEIDQKKHYAKKS